MYLRNFIETDANTILSWINSERELRLWSADRYGEYPILAVDIADNYKKCSECGGFYPMTLVDEEEHIIGHLIFRHPGEDKRIVRLGFIIVDSKMRGKGYGRTLIKLAIKYAKEELNASEINLGVFKENESAYRCYASVGFKEISVEKNAYCYNGECWDCVEMVLVELNDML